MAESSRDLIYLRATLSLLVLVGAPAGTVAQSSNPYVVPRTAYDQPDFQGVWAPDFATTLERPEGVENLIATPEDAKAIAAVFLNGLPDNIDSDIENHGIVNLAQVLGEYRTSVIVEPEDGKMPLSEVGLELVDWAQRRREHMFDSADQRPLAERCLEGWGSPPIRAAPLFVPHQIFQSRDTFVILTEDAVGLRLIHLQGAPPSDSLRSLDGYSRGRWEGDTLVVETTHFRGEDPAREVFGRALLIGPKTRLTERFTRVSDRELLYRFTVEDDELYTQAWTGEFSMTRHDVPIFEFACHEGNYSMPTILRGGQAEASRLSPSGEDY